MRIKSYFANSVQAAISMARKEFGDCVTLVTSHIAAPESRHLGQYEVVFAIEQVEKAPVAEELPKQEPAAVPAFTEFQQMLLETVAPKEPEPEAAVDAIACIRESLIALGFEASVAAALITVIEQARPKATSPTTSISVKPAEVSEESVRVEPKAQPEEPVVAEVSRKYPHLSIAELSFLSAVAGSPGAELDANS